MLHKILSYHKSILIFAALCLFLVWNMAGRQLAWQYLFAEPTEATISNLPLVFNINPLPESTPQIIPFGKYNIEITLRAEATITARVIYVDFYGQAFYLGKKTPNALMREVYDTVSPLDLSIVSGASAQDGNWQKFEISHEYRTLFYRYEYADRPIFNYGDFNNLHILPASNAVRRAFDILKPGDIVSLKGLLIDWRDTGEFAAFPYRTAQTIGQIADFKLGGQISGLCYYLYVTELATDGYIYR